MLTRHAAGLLGLLLAAACSAGNYDISVCDPTVPNLGSDVCNSLNTSQHPEVSACTVYQCSAQSGQCALGTLDYDRDGDPPVACGGTDCNDTDPTINGINKTCVCSSGLLGAPCSAGVGACLVKSTYQCKNNALYCAEPGTPGDFSDHPNPSNGSWDWNCDGMIETNCRTPGSNQIMSCPQTNCDANMTALAEAGKYDSACDAFCQTLMWNDGRCAYNAASLLLLCDASCGAPLLSCPCRAMLFQQFCRFSGTALSSTVVCK